MRESVRFILVGASLLVACGSASSSADSGKAAEAASGGARGGTPGGAAGFGEGGALLVAGSAGAIPAGGANGGSNLAGSAGAQAGNSGLGGSSSWLFIDRIRYDNPSLCLPDPLPTNAALDQTTCVVVEARPHACDCTAAGRAPASPTLVTEIEDNLRAAGSCGATGVPACADFCLCNIVQEGGANGAACKTDAVAAGMSATVSPGFCYTADSDSPQLASCPSNEKQKLLFVSKATDPTPSPGALAFLACPR